MYFLTCNYSELYNVEHPSHNDLWGEEMEVSDQLHIPAVSILGKSAKIQI
jgi:hypothetical protein